jgi:choline dehydrogenase-like flavoprotein
MYTDARELPDGSTIRGDICIIGAGAAGISMALEWIGSGKSVVLLEGGGFTIEREMQDLNEGESLGQRYFPLRSSRLRWFGGTTGHWAGFCSTLDPIDFEKRDWVQHSGWPFGRAELDPFYARAHKVLELGPYEYDPDYWEKENSDYVQLPLDRSRIQTKMWQFSPPTRFGEKYRDDITGSEDIHLYINANVCDIEANEEVTEIKRVHVRTHDGKQHSVEARHYVLACGAIQNSRLLLASNKQASAGLGNDHDWVGRCFTEHPEVNTGYLVLNSPAPLEMYMFNLFITKARGEITLSKEVQKEHRILNCSISLSPGETDIVPDAWINMFPDEARETMVMWDVWENAFVRGEFPLAETEGQTEYVLFTRSEQQPNPDSRIVLSSEKDALDVPRADLDWQLSPLDKRTIRKTYEILAREVGRAGLGRIKLMDWVMEDDRTWPDHLSGGWHHMGTTRMHESPAMGVVDPDCKVHGISNLFVAGSATFPTGGVANPTLSIVAMSLRLSDHLKMKIKRNG